MHNEVTENTTIWACSKNVYNINIINYNLIYVFKIYSIEPILESQKGDF